MIFSLIKNEWIKLFSKKSTYVIIFLIMLLSITVPVITYISDTRIYDNANYRKNLENEKSYLQNAVNMTENGKSDKDFYYQSAYNKGSLEIADLKLAANVTGYEDWRERQSYQLNTLYVEKNLIDYYLTKNKDAVKEIENNGHTFEIDKDALDYYHMYNSTKKLSARSEQLNIDIENYRNAIMNNDPAFINQLNVSIAVKNIENTKKEIDESNKNLKYADKNSREEINKQIADYQTLLQKQNELLEWADYRLDNQISLNTNDWKNLSILAITNAIEKTYSHPMEKDDYDKAGKNSEYGENLTYDEYMIKFTEDVAKAKDDILLYTYSLDNNIPPMKYTDSTRKSIQNIYYVITFVSMAMIFLISPMVSNEYSKGTIRLLLIRPVKRYKVLLSKFLAALGIAVILLALCGILYIAVSILLFGTADFNYPILSVQNGAIVSTTILSTVIPVLIKSSIVILFIMSMSFAFSTIMKSTVFAVGLPFAIIAFSWLIVILLVQLKYYAFVQYSLFPYINMANIITESGAIGDYMKFIPQLHISAEYGMVLLGSLTALMLALSFWVFNKRDVKN